MTPSGGHAPVMLAETIEALAPQAGDIIVDGTFGGGGYSRAILNASRCTVVAIDRDLDAIERAEALAAKNKHLVPVLGRFGDMQDLVTDLGCNSVDGIVLDVGVSSFQIDQSERGFSFLRDGPLDMRMGQAGPSAATVVNCMAERDLANVIFRLGEERQSRRIARAIVSRRADKDFETTLELADTISDAVGGRKGARIHPATRTFQAIRMYVNEELRELARALAAAEALLGEGGRLVVVTFHSLEDRLVKLWLKERSQKTGGGSRHLPKAVPGSAPTFFLARNKPVLPGEKEVETNPRARSAKLRAAIRTNAPATQDEPDDGMKLPPLSELEAAA